MHLILVLGETNSQYNEHCLPRLEDRTLTIVTYFPAELTPPAAISLYPGDGTLLGFFRALRTALDAQEYDVLHAHSPHIAVLLPLGVLSRRRFWRLWHSMLLTVHDSFYDFKPRNKVLMLAGLALFPSLTFCSRSAFRSLPAPVRVMTTRRARVVQNAADLHHVARELDGVDVAEDGAFRIVSVGRLEPVKDPRAVVAAFAAGADAGCRLELVGAGSLEQDLRSDIQARGLGDRVRLLGLVPRVDVFRSYARSKLFVSLSHGEGLPIAVMEAMAAALPVVLSDIPPHRELVDGLDVVPLVEPGDIVGLAREISRFRAMTEEERRQIGRRCQDWVMERFTLEQMHAGYDRVYREILSRGGRR